MPEGPKGGPKGPNEAQRVKGGPKGLRLEVGARRAPELLVLIIICLPARDRKVSSLGYSPIPY